MELTIILLILVLHCICKDCGGNEEEISYDILEFKPVIQFADFSFKHISGSKGIAVSNTCACITSADSKYKYLGVSTLSNTILTGYLPHKKTAIMFNITSYTDLEDIEDKLRLFKGEEEIDIKIIEPIGTGEKSDSSFAEFLYNILKLSEFDNVELYVSDLSAKENRYLGVEYAIDTVTGEIFETDKVLEFFHKHPDFVSSPFGLRQVLDHAGPVNGDEELVGVTIEVDETNSFVWS